MTTAEKVTAGAAIALGLFALANGLVMLAAPQQWFWRVPGVSTSGGYNQHFIRDIGMIYALIGASFLIGIRAKSQRAALWSFSAAWLAAHALFHFWEVAVGICGTDAIPRDFPGVTAPAIVAVLLAASAWRPLRMGSGSSPE